MKNSNVWLISRPANLAETPGAERRTPESRSVFTLPPNTSPDPVEQQADCETTAGRNHNVSLNVHSDVVVVTVAALTPSCQKLHLFIFCTIKKSLLSRASPSSSGDVILYHVCDVGGQRRDESSQGEIRFDGFDQICVLGFVTGTLWRHSQLRILTSELNGTHQDFGSLYVRDKYFIHSRGAGGLGGCWRPVTLIIDVISVVLVVRV